MRTVWYRWKLWVEIVLSAAVSKVKNEQSSSTEDLDWITSRLKWVKTTNVIFINYVINRNWFNKVYQQTSEIIFIFIFFYKRAWRRAKKQGKTEAKTREPLKWTSDKVKRRWRYMKKGICFFPTHANLWCYDFITLRIRHVSTLLQLITLWWWFS